MIRFLVNPAAGGGRGGKAVAELRRLAESHGGHLAVSRDAVDLGRQARQAAADGAERLLVAGGDGTFHHVAQALAGTECALGLLPLGRGNDLAATLGVPRTLAAAVERALTAPVRSIDLGHVEGRHFACYCGAGFDSEVARFVQQRPLRFGGPAVYVYGVLRTLVRFRAPLLTVEHDGGRFEERAMFAVLSNTPRFGGGMLIAPAAGVDDGFLDLVIVREVSRLELLKVFPRVYRGRHVDHPAVTILRTRRARVAVDREVWMFADGEPLRRLGPEPVEVTVAPAALRVVCG